MTCRTEQDVGALVRALRSIAAGDYGSFYEPNSKRGRYWLGAWA